MTATGDTFRTAAALHASLASRAARAQDTTSKGITLVGNYDPLRGKAGVVVLPITGAFGDSVRTIIQRDLDYSDRFTVIAVDSSDPTALRGTNGGGLNYSLFGRLSASVVAQVTPVPAGLHVSMHDVAKGQVVGVFEMALPSTGLSRDWRLAVHRVSDEIERWVTGQRGIAATRIAYLRAKSIRMVDSDGANGDHGTDGTGRVSPGLERRRGTMLAYTTFGVDSRLLLLDLATGRSRSLLGPQRNSTFVSPDHSSPDWEPSFAVHAVGGRTSSDIYRMLGCRRERDPRRRLTVNGIGNTNAIMSPDGRRIVYVNGELGRPELYIMDSDGTNASRLYGLQRQRQELSLRSGLVARRTTDRLPGKASTVTSRSGRSAERGSSPKS